MLFGSALVVALGVVGCGGDGGNRTGTGSSDAPTASDEPADPGDTPASTTRPPLEAEPPLRRPKPTVSLSVTPPPVKPPSVPTDRLEPVTVTGTLSEPVPGCPAPEVVGASGAPVIPGAGGAARLRWVGLRDYACWILISMSTPAGSSMR